MSLEQTNYQLALKLGQQLLAKQLRCVVAESCTGGLLCAAITDIPGSSEWFDRGFVTYSNQSKQALLGVSESLILSCGAVSESVVVAMSEGALCRGNGELSVAISGIAGPSGGSIDKPVGTVWIAWSRDQQPTIAKQYCFDGDRQLIREQAVQVALEGMLWILNANQIKE